MVTKMLAADHLACITLLHILLKINKTGASGDLRVVIISQDTRQ